MKKLIKDEICETCGGFRTTFAITKKGITKVYKKYWVSHVGNKCKTHIWKDFNKVRK